MNISYDWLGRFIEIGQEPRQLAATLTSLGLECDTVEEVEAVPGGLRGVVIGKVLTCVPHPDSDHLHITTVDLGGPEPVQIVCGAPNVAAGQTVPVATIGCVLRDKEGHEFKIKKSKMRGVESFGMICAADELGLGTDHAGIMVLEETKPGTPAADYFNLASDWCLETELTPNRVDAASHLGTARDLSAWKACRNFQGEQAGDPAVTLPSVEGYAEQRREGGIKVKVLDEQGCPRYAGVTIRGVRVAESPEWLRRLLTAAGQRPINNVVDVTNFVLLGLGQPLHCFDLAHVHGDEIQVRTCADGTPFTTLDGVEHRLSDRDVMICDDEKPLCIAGVFGGLDSGVTESTTDIFIESAYFNPTRVRRTARRHGLSTDASFRYERGTDPNILPYAARLAAVMIQQLGGGEICGPLRDTRPEGFAPFPVALGLNYCESLIGKRLDPELIACILRALEIEITATDVTDSDTVLHLLVPRYRVDVTRPCDVVEEILRVYGYNNVETPERTWSTQGCLTEVDESRRMQARLSDWLSARGFNEILNNSLTSVAYYDGNERWPLAECVSLLNPLSRDLGVMRQTLLYGGLESMQRNVNRRAADLRFYEFGNVYHNDASKEITAERPLCPFSEEMHLDLWMTGLLTPAGWQRPAVEATVFDLKADVEALLQKMGIPAGAVVWTQGADTIFAARLTLSNRGGKVLGELGVLRKGVTAPFDIEAPVCYATLRWQPLMRLGSGKVDFAPLPKTQPVRRDLALLLPAAVTFAQVETAVRKAERRLLRSVTLFDVYEGKGIPEGFRSYAIALTLQDNEKTLTDKQIESAVTKITAVLTKELGAQQR